MSSAGSDPYRSPESKAGRPRLAARAIAATLACTGALAIVACGSDEEGFPPPAEPAASPQLSTDPAGIVIDLDGGEAEGITADPQTGTVVVATRDPDRLFLVSEPTAARPRITEVKIPESPRHIQLAAPGGPALATAERTDQLLEINLPDGDLRTTKVGDFPHDAGADPADPRRIYVGDEGADTVSVVEDGRRTRTVPAPEQPGGIAALEDRFAVVAVAERVVSLYDDETLAELARVDAGVGPTHAVAGDDGRLYVADTQGDAILVFETRPELRLVDRANVSDSPYGIAIDNENDRLWVTQTGRNSVVELELTDLAPKRLRSFATVRQPNTVAVDPATGLVFVAGRTDGVLQVINPEADRPEQ